MGIYFKMNHEQIMRLAEAMAFDEPMMEMARPTPALISSVLYHGTDKGDEILKSGFIQGRMVQGKARQAPTVGYIYEVLRQKRTTPILRQKNH